MPVEARIAYIAAPYSDPDPAVVAGRMAAFEHAVGVMIRVGDVFPVSPLLNHYLLEKLGVPGDWEFWQHYSRRLLGKCDELVVIELPGWQDSSGVKGEIEFANLLSLPIRFVGYSFSVYQDAIQAVRQPG